ncbi:MAG: hypothetical protein JST54_28745 [Deltaproteobacteria bacterium]|nr:hypothetical protein [Deltaproteobacteria bacterium]
MKRWPILALLALAPGCTRSTSDANANEPLPVVDLPPEPPSVIPSEPAPAPKPIPAPALAVAAPTQAPAAPTADAFRWEIEAPGAAGKLSQKPGSPPGTCELSWYSERTRQVVWTSKRCLGTRDDLFFVAPDGRRVLTLHPAVEGARWQELPVAELSRVGERVSEVTAEQAFSGNTGLAPTSGKLVWLHGVGDLPGPKPALTPEGEAVAFTRIDGQMMKIDFDGHLFRVDINPAPPPEPSMPEAADAPPEPEPQPKPQPKPAPAAPKKDDPNAYMKRIIEAQNCKQFGRCKDTYSMGADSPDNQIDNSRNSSVIGHDQNQIPDPNSVGR